GAVDQVEDLEGSPDVVKAAEGVMAPAMALFAIEEQRAETDIDADIGVDGQSIPIMQIAGDAEREIAAIQEIQIGLEVLIGGEVVLEKQTEGEQPVGRAAYPAHGRPGAVEG